MDRITHTNKGMAWYKSDLLLLEPCELSIPQIAEVIRHLAAYEDTGLTPEEVKEKVRQLDTIVERYGLYHDGRGDAILELLKACKEGRLKIVKKPPEGAHCGNCSDFIRVPGTARGTCRTQYQKRYGRTSEHRNVAQSTNACHAFTPKGEPEAGL